MKRILIASLFACLFAVSAFAVVPIGSVPRGTGKPPNLPDCGDSGAPCPKCQPGHCSGDCGFRAMVRAALDIVEGA